MTRGVHGTGLRKVEGFRMLSPTHPVTAVQHAAEFVPSNGLMTIRRRPYAHSSPSWKRTSRRL